MSLARIRSAQDAHDWLRDRWDADGRYEWVVEDDEGTALGRVGLHNREDVEVGYWVLPAARGRGVASRAARAVARHGHDVLGLARIGLVHAVGNPASCRVAAAAGFGYEGTARAQYEHLDGVRYDYHHHARLATDPWEPLAPTQRVPETVRGEGLVLTPWASTDLPAILEAATDPDIRVWAAVPFADEVGAARWLAGETVWDGHLSWAVRESDSGPVLARVALHHLLPTHGRAEVGYWVLPRARGRGVCSRAVRTATSYGAATLGLERVELYHAVENGASCGVARAAGYRAEGVLRRAFRYGDGRLHDDHLHAWLPGDSEVP